MTYEFLIPRTGKFEGDTPAERRVDFEAFLRGRLEDPRQFVTEAEDARRA